MIKNFVTLFFRNLRRQRLFSLINLSGLTVSIVSTLLIFLYVDHELAYDGFHPNIERLYRVNQTFIWAEDDKNQFSRTGPGVAVALKEELPEVEMVTSLHTPQAHIISYTKPSGEIISFEEEDILAADTNFFRIFNFPLTAGDPASAFSLANTLMMTKSTATKYFGKENPIGKLVILSGTEREPQTYEVTGVLEDLPENTTIKFDVLLSMKNFPVDRLHWSWVWTQLETFVLLREKADIEAVREKLTVIPKKRAEETLQRVMNVSYDDYIKSGKTWDLYLQPVSTLHLPEEPVVGSFDDVGSITIVYALIGAAAFIVLLSCINFMNLSTAQFTKRIKEASVRKVLGLGRKELSLNYLLEAIAFCTLATVLALCIIQMLLPLFNSLTQKTLSITGENIGEIALGLAALIVLMSVVSSSYPSLFLGSFNPAAALKGKIKTGKSGQGFRNGLVVFQFTVSIVLVACTAIVFQQLQFFYTKDIGFNKENLVTIRHLESIKNKDEATKAMTQIAGVTNASVCSSTPPSIFGGDSFTAEGTNENFSLNFTTGDEEYIPVLGIKLVLGRNFSKDQPYDKYRVIINEATVRKLGWPMDESVIGKKIMYPYSKPGERFEVIGVVSDFNYWSLDVDIQPMAIFHVNNEYANGGPRRQIVLRIDQTRAESWDHTIATLESVWKKHAGDVPFDYGFVDEYFAESFQTQERFGKVLVVMSTLAILIACFGLLGMIIYALEQRTKEIGIRKISGASVMNILTLISTSYSKLIVIAFVIGTFISYSLMDRWLEDFAYRIKPSIWIFIGAGGGTFIIAILITGYHSVKAALSNPVDVLRSE